MGASCDIAIVGATGLVGEAVVELLEERRFPLGNLHLFASERSAGTRVEFRGGYVTVRELDEFDFSTVQLAIFAAGPEVAEAYAPRAADAGCVAIDTSGRFRDAPGVPLVVAAVNPEAIEDFRETRILATPGAAATQLLTALQPLRAGVGIERVQVTTLLPVSAQGRNGIEELASQTAALLNGQPIESRVFTRQIAFNVLPDIAGLGDYGYTQLEMQLVHELRRVWGEPDLPIHASIAWFPGFYGCLQDVRIESPRSLSADAARRLLEAAPGLRVLDDESGEVPNPVEAAGQGTVYVGRIRSDLAETGGLALWTAADNIRQGVAENAVRIAELFVKGYL